MIGLHLHGLRCLKGQHSQGSGTWLAEAMRMPNNHFNVWVLCCRVITSFLSREDTKRSCKIVGSVPPGPAVHYEKGVSTSCYAGHQHSASLTLHAMQQGPCT